MLDLGQFQPFWGPGVDRNSPERHSELSRPVFLFSTIKMGIKST